MSKFPKRPTLMIRSANDPDLLDGIINECDILGWRVVNLMFTDWHIEPVDTPIAAIFARTPQDSTISNLRKSGIPVVNIWRAIDDPTDVDACVSEDRLNGGRLAADVFAERGFKNFGYVTSTNAHPSGGLFDGFVERTEAHGETVRICFPEDTPETGNERHEAQVRVIAEWLKDQPKPLAILAFNYRMAIRITCACELAGLSIPEQIAIVCQGNSYHLCRTAPVPLSAIDMNRHELGRQAVRTVKRLVDGEVLSQEPICVPVKGFVERRSTDILAVSDPRVAKALRFMWDHLSWPISVDDVAYEANTARNTLERAFRRCLNRGIFAELRRKRMEVCKELLRTTTMTSTEIAKAIGLGSRRHVHRAFKAAFGITPTEYRKSCRKPLTGSQSD